jgi:aminopeptidase
MPSPEQRLDAYAELALRVGVNLQPGQRLIIWAPVEAAPLVHLVTARAYKMGARLVETIYRDDAIVRARFDHAPRDSFEEHSTWMLHAGLEYAENGHAVLSIHGTDPDLLKGVDPALVATAQKTQGRVMEPYGRLISGDKVNWCVIAYPVEKWACKVFPGRTAAEAQASLWESIYSIVRLDAPDPIVAWQDHAARLSERTAYLNGRQYNALHFRGPGTDLTVGLPYNHRWLGGAAPAGNGITNIANVPTEEVFTAPDRARVDGVVRATMPLNYGGNLIENFSLTFKDGRVTGVQAEKGESLLRSMIEADEGAARLGEVALVPASSPISRTGVLFYNTLFDENAASHIALGRAYTNCIAGCEGLSNEDFNAMGGNTSIIHVDFMIGSAEIDLDGLTDEGTAEPLMRAGEWV